MTNVPRFAPLLFAALSAGCMPTIDIEPRSLPLPSRSAAESCYQQHRIEVTTGTARASYSQGSYSPFTGYMTVQTVTWRGGGVAFYQGGEPLLPREAALRLDDRELLSAYDAKLAHTKGASVGYEASRDSALILAFGGLALTLVALGQAVAQSSQSTPDHPVHVSIPVTLWIGTGVAVSSIIPTIIASTTYEGAKQHAVDERLMPPSLVDRSLFAIAQHNKRAMAACGLEDGDPLPLSPTARGYLR